MKIIGLNCSVRRKGNTCETISYALKNMGKTLK